MTFWTHILHCADGSYCTGHTDDLDHRIASHHAGEVDGYTKTRRPVALRWSPDFAAQIDALEAERRIKGWSRAKKEALIAGDWQRVSQLARNRQDDGRPSPNSGRTGTGIAP